MIDLLFNLALLLFWVRLLPPDRQPAYYNPYIAWIHNLSRSALNVIRTLLPGLSQTSLAALAFSFLLGLRALVMALPADSAGVWTLRFGFERMTPATGFPARLGFSLLSFGVILFYLGAAHALLVRRLRGNAALSECLTLLVRPLGNLPPARRWAAVALLGLGLGIGLAVCGISLVPGETWLATPVSIRFAGRMLVNTAAALAGLLPILQSLLLAAIIGSWIALLVPSESLAGFCREALDFLIGPLRRYRIAIGLLDLMPLLAWLALAVAYQILARLLWPLYRITLA